MNRIDFSEESAQGIEFELSTDAPIVPEHLMALWEQNAETIRFEAFLDLCDQGEVSREYFFRENVFRESFVELANKNNINTIDGYREIAERARIGRERKLSREVLIKWRLDGMFVNPSRLEIPNTKIPEYIEAVNVFKEFNVPFRRRYIAWVLKWEPLEWSRIGIRYYVEAVERGEIRAIRFLEWFLEEALSLGFSIPFLEKLLSREKSVAAYVKYIKSITTIFPSQKSDYEQVLKEAMEIGVEESVLVMLRTKLQSLDYSFPPSLK